MLVDLHKQQNPSELTKLSCKGWLHTKYKPRIQWHCVCICVCVCVCMLQLRPTLFQNISFSINKIMLKHFLFTFTGWNNVLIVTYICRVFCGSQRGEPDRGINNHIRFSSDTQPFTDRRRAQRCCFGNLEIKKLICLHSQADCSDLLRWPLLSVFMSHYCDVDCRRMGNALCLVNITLQRGEEGPNRSLSWVPNSESLP